MLCAFLLSLPFLTRFALLTRVGRDAYYAASLCAAVGTIMPMAPSANHRLRFREDDKGPMLLWFNRLVLVGTAFLVAAVAAAWVVIEWYVTPLWQRRRHSAE